MKIVKDLYSFLCIIKVNFTSWRSVKTRGGVKILFLVLLFAFAGNQSAWSQNMNDRISFGLKDQSLNQGLKQLGKASGFKMAYTLQQVEKFKNLTIAKESRTVEATLELLLANTDLTYRVKGNNILIVGKKAATQPAQSRKKVSGIVVDNENNPLPGVSILLPGTANGAITAGDGSFNVEVSEDAEMVFSFVGFETKIVKATKESTLRVTLSPDQNILDEVQVIGYGTTTRRLKTSGVATLKEGEIASQPTSSNFLQAMQGKMAGVMINQTGGGVGTSPDIYVRGQNSITSGNSPLYIVDGVIVSDATIGSGNGFTGSVRQNALSSINQSDIVSIDVLKDADATAIYGSRGANGVVLITTKKAEIGKTSFTLDASTGFNDPMTTKYLNLEQYLALRKEAFTTAGVTPTASNAPDLLSWSQTEGKDWTKELNKGNGSIYNLNGTLTGGTKSFSYLASLGYSLTHDTYFTNPYDRKISGKLNLNHTSENNKFKASFNMSFSNEDYNPGLGSSSNTATSIYTLPPNMPVRNTDGSYYWGGGIWTSYRNYYATSESSYQTKITDYLLSADVSYLLYKGLTLKLAASYNNQHGDNILKLRAVSISPVGASSGTPGVTESLSTFSSFNLEPQLTYANTFGKAKVDALVGSTWFSKSSDGRGLTMTNYLTEAAFDDYSSAGIQKVTSSFSQYNMRSWFARANANWDNRYIANLTYRTDGSSRFGTNNRWGNFGAVGAAWIYSNESFVKNALPWLSYGKLRGSYGVTGNDNIPDFRYLSLSSVNGYYGGSAGLFSSYLPNEDIKWETTKKIEVALENSFLNDRLSTSVAYFRNRTTNMLLSVSIPSQGGYDSMLENFDGIVDNKGWEIELNSTNIKTKGFSWKTGFNITFQKNELVKKPEGIGGSTSYDQYFEGKPLKSYIGYLFSRVDPATGNALWINPETGDEEASVSGSLQYLGGKLPTIFGGLTNSLSYKGFTLDFSISFAKKVMTNALYSTGLYPGSANNLPTMILGKYWTKAGDVATYPKLDPIATNSNSSNGYAYNYGPTLHEGFYFKLQNVALSYTLPTKWVAKIGGQNASLYVRGQNLFYVTPGVELGKDPEREASGGLNLLRSYVLGLNVKF